MLTFLSSNLMDINSVAHEFLCPICHRLPSDPVIAGDGFIYDRECLYRIVRNKNHPSDVFSPMTKEEMVSNLVDSKAISQTITELAASEQLNKSFLSDGKSNEIQGAKHDSSAKALQGFRIIRGEIAEDDWGEGYELLVEVALESNQFALYILGRCYRDGIYKFKKDLKKSDKWMVKVEDPLNVESLWRRECFCTSGPQDISKQSDNCSTATAATATTSTIASIASHPTILSTDMSQSIEKEKERDALIIELRGRNTLNEQSIDHNRKCTSCSRIVPVDGMFEGRCGDCIARVC
mmetsp:Transcript_8029/g.15364  ORF Transcript_8029/g.15364 Transcript_8029/m.15364 type:complete len:294 (+) Transcript_8029:215-1096(+)